MFDDINDAQWSWYQTQLVLDEKEKYEFYRDLEEHNAMFWNSEGVQQIRDARENTFQTPDEDFSGIVENIFGREAPSFNKDEKSDKPKVEPVRKSDPYLNMDLDEIVFTPYVYEDY